MSLKNLSLLLLVPLFVSCTGVDFVINGNFDDQQNKISLYGDKGLFFVEAGQTQIKLNQGIVAVKKPQMIFSQKNGELGRINLPENFFKDGAINAPAETTGQHYDLTGKTYDKLDKTFERTVNDASCVTGSHLMFTTSSTPDGLIQSHVIPITDYGTRVEHRLYSVTLKMLDASLIDPSISKTVAHFTGVVGEPKVDYKVLYAGPCK